MCQFITIFVITGVGSTQLYRLFMQAAIFHNISHQLKLCTTSKQPVHQSSFVNVEAGLYQKFVVE